MSGFQLSTAAQQTSGPGAFPGADLQSIAALINNQTFAGLVQISASGAIPILNGGTYIITATGVAALTLAAPTAGVQDDMTIRIASVTAHAHTVTATGLLLTGSASVDEATFAAHAGAGLTLMAYQGDWVVVAANAVTFS